MGMYVLPGRAFLEGRTLKVLATDRSQLWRCYNLGEEETKFNGSPRATKEPIMSFECSHQEVPGNPGVSWVLTRLKGEA